MEVRPIHFGGEPDPNSTYLQKFRLYETRSNFYMIGRDKARSFCRLLKIDRLEPSDLSILEDSMVYSESDCSDLLERINEGNKSTGGLKFVTICYGIVGFIKFLGPYYMLLITKRRKVGTICGHSIYAISKSEMIPIPNSTLCSNMTNSKNENRSFVHSKCKCNVYLVLLERSMRVGCQNCTDQLYIAEEVFSSCYCFSFSTFMVWDKILSCASSIRSRQVQHC